MNQPTDADMPDTAQTIHDLLADVMRRVDHQTLTTGTHGSGYKSGRDFYVFELGEERAHVVDRNECSQLLGALIVAWVQAECARRGWTSSCRDYPSTEQRASEWWEFTVWHDDDGIWEPLASVQASSLAVATLTALLGALTAEVAS